MSKAATRKKVAAAPVKKTTFSDREYVAMAPPEDDIAVLKDGGRYLPIDVVERDLDRWPWRTENFTWQLFVDQYGKKCVGASLDLVIPWNDGGRLSERRLTGACNFNIASYAPNGHFVATAKSECVKNAASDLGKKFGRGLNEEAAPSPEPAATAKKSAAKMIPDGNVLAQFKAAKMRGDQTFINIFSDVYEIPKEENETNESLHQ
jgi:hypothetical protein